MSKSVKYMLIFANDGKYGQKVGYNTYRRGLFFPSVYLFH